MIYFRIQCLVWSVSSILNVLATAKMSNWCSYAYLIDCFLYLKIFFIRLRSEKWVFKQRILLSRIFSNDNGCNCGMKRTSRSAFRHHNSYAFGKKHHLTLNIITANHRYHEKNNIYWCWEIAWFNAFLMSSNGNEPCIGWAM